MRSGAVDTRSSQYYARGMDDAAPAEAGAAVEKKRRFSAESQPHG
jgi:hypothetical protein